MSVQYPRRREELPVDKLTSILAVVDPADETRKVVVKAMVLARHFGARLELFLCDSESAYSMRHAYDPTGLEHARRQCVSNGQRYLDAICRTLAEDVTVSTHVACSSPLYEAIVQRVIQTRPDFVVKSAAGHHPLQRFTLDANDWQLARTCPAPLLLTRGVPWSAEGRFAAAVDVADPDGAALSRSIMQAAGFLTLGCRGRLDVIFCERDTHDTAAVARHKDALTRLVNEFSVGGERQQVLAGEADDTLPQFTARQGYDLIVLGALTRRHGPASLMGTLTSRMVDAMDCDFVLVKSDPCTTPRASLSDAD
jgi:universal stress protein E